MYKTHYTLKMSSGSGLVDKEFDTYRDAYDYMCRMYCRELSEGYIPTLYKIIKTDTTTRNGSTNTMVQPVWSE